MPTWRDHPQHFTGYLYLHKPEVLFAARVNQSSFDFTGPGLAELTYDTVTVGAYTDAVAGLTVFLGSASGLNDLGWQRLRKNADGTKIYIGASSRGDKRGEINPTDNVYITVLNLREVWAKVPRILADGTIYKDYEITPSTYGTQPPPIANIRINPAVGLGGQGWADFVDDGGIITIQLDGSGSIVMDVDASPASPAYLWDVADGTIISGSTTSAAPTVTFPAGFRYVSLTYSDTNGHSHTTYAPIFAAEPTGANAPIHAQVDRRRLAADGQEMSFLILDDVPAADYPDGTLVMYWEREWNGTAEFVRTHFIGWHQTDEATIRREKTGLLRDTLLECADVGKRLATLPGFPQVLQHKDTPSKWTDFYAPDPELYVHYLLHWHSTALELAFMFFDGFGFLFPFFVLGSDGDSLWGQADRVAEAMASHLTCNSKGWLAFHSDPQLADRFDAPPSTAITRTTEVVDDLTEADFTELHFTHQPHPSIHWLRGEAIIAVPDSHVESVFCDAPGAVPGQGEGEQTQGRQLVTDQDELNAREGHRYVRINAPESMFDLTLVHGNWSSIEPADLKWVTVTLSAQYAAQRGLNFTEAKFLPIELEISYPNDDTGRIKEQRLRLEREVYGLPAQTFIPATKNSPNYTAGSVLFPKTDWRPVSGSGSFQLQKGTGNIALVAQDGYVYKTSDWTTPSSSGGPTWTRVSLGISGIADFCVDAGSPLYLGTGSTVNGWVVNSTGIYYVQNFFGASPTVTLQHTFDVTGIDLTNDGKVVIEFGWGNLDWGVCIFFYKDTSGHEGTWATYTMNGGTSWSTEAQIDSHIGISGFGVASPGLFVSSRIPGMAYTSVPIANYPTDDFRIFQTTDYGANWTQISSPSGFKSDKRFAGHIICPWDDNADQSIVYFGGKDGTDNFLKRKNRDGTISDISPVYSGNKYQPYWRWGLQVCPINRQRVIMQGLHDTLGKGPVFVSRDAGDTWTALTSMSAVIDADFDRVFIAGNDANTLYVWGIKLYYSTDFGVTADSKLGNIPTDFPSYIRFVGIMGG